MVPSIYIALWIPFEAAMTSMAALSENSYLYCCNVYAIFRGRVAIIIVALTLHDRLPSIETFLHYDDSSIECNRLQEI